MQCFKNIFIPSKDYPEFWQDYSNAFKKKNNKYQRLVVLDCETTGLNPKQDRILSIGAIGIQNNVIQVKDQFSVFVKQNLSNPKSISIHGILQNNVDCFTNEKEAIRGLLQYLGNSKIIGHHISFDIQMINLALQREGLPNLKNKVLDTTTAYAQFKGVNFEVHKSLDELCEEFGIQLKDRHTALGDAFLTALVYQRMQIT